MQSCVLVHAVFGRQLRSFETFGEFRGRKKFRDFQGV